MTRAEHLQWCKDRAIQEMEYTNEPAQGMASFMSDMKKHPETKDHSALELGLMMMFGGHLNNKEEVKKFIEGFN